MRRKKKIENPNMKPIPRIWHASPFVMLVCWPLLMGVVIIPTMFVIGYSAYGVCYLIDSVQWFSKNCIGNVYGRGVFVAMAISIYWIFKIVIKINDYKSKDKIDRERRKKESEMLAIENLELSAELKRVISEKGRNHPKTGFAYHLLGENLEQMGNRQAALEAFRAELEVFRTTLGEKSFGATRASECIADLVNKSCVSSEEKSVPVKNTGVSCTGLAIWILATSVFILFGAGALLFVCFIAIVGGILFSTLVRHFLKSSTTLSLERKESFEELAFLVGTLVPAGFFLFICFQGWVQGRL
jgi:hypothetical protein